MKNVYVLLIILFLLTGCTHLEYKETFDTLKYQNNNYLYDEDINTTDIFINDEYTIEKDTIDTSTVGKKKMYIYYSYKNKMYKELFEYNVIDNEEPLIWMAKSYTYKTGSEDNLLERIICADNYDIKPNCYIDGEYDFSTPGTYNLKLIAVDSSNNIEENDFVLNIKDELEEIQTEDEEKIYFEDIITNYKNDNTMVGIDVSKYQGDIDFKKVKDAGVEFVIIRMGLQTYFDEDYELDPYFKQNIENALANNLKVGIYFYSYAKDENDAIKQAKYVIKNIKDYDITMPVAFDWENFKHWNEININLTELKNTAYAFEKVINDAGYTAVHYGSKNYLNSFWNPIKYDTWVAQYTVQNTYDKDYIMWQLCNTGVVDGIDGDVDIDIYYQQ